MEKLKGFLIKSLIFIVPIILIIIFIVAFIFALKDMKASADGEQFEGVYGNTIQEKVWFALKDCGFSDEQVAGAMGNIHYESISFNPEQIEIGYDENTGGIGLCQWTNVDRGTEGNNTNLKNYAAFKEKTWKDEDTQVEFLVTYLTGTGLATEFTSNAHLGRTYFGTYYEATAWENYKSTGNLDTDLEYTTKAFLANYEGPGESYAESSISERIKWSKTYYNEFHGKVKSQSGSGNEKSSDTAGIKGYYKSSSGKTYTEYLQNISGTSWYWESGCFHCSLATIMSGFGSTKTPNQLTNWGGDGNQADAAQVGCSYPYISASEVKDALKKGNPVMMEIPQYNTLTTDNGSHQFSLSQHWVALLDYKSEGGVDKAYVHDPWDGEPCYGWGNLNTIVNAGSRFIHFYKNN